MLAAFPPFLVKSSNCPPLSSRTWGAQALHTGGCAHSQRQLLKPLLCCWEPCSCCCSPGTAEGDQSTFSLLAQQSSGMLPVPTGLLSPCAALASQAGPEGLQSTQLQGKALGSSYTPEPGLCETECPGHSSEVMAKGLCPAPPSARDQLLCFSSLTRQEQDRNKQDTRRDREKQHQEQCQLSINPI